MASARPVVFVGPEESEPAEAIRASGGGAVVSNGSGRDLASELLALRADARLRRRLGEAGRRYFLRRHERDVCCASWVDLLASLGASAEAAEPIGAAVEA